MSVISPDPRPHEHPFRGFDRSVQHVLGADMRMLYGMAIPVLMVVGMIIVLALSPATWLVISILVLEVAALALVVYGLMGLLNESEEQDAEDRVA
jgi:zinc transporter ZupT